MRSTWRKVFTASDVLEQLFDDDSFSGSDSNGEDEDAYAYRGLTLSASNLREEETFGEHFSGKCFYYSESALYLDKTKAVLSQKNSIYVSWRWI